MYAHEGIIIPVIMHCRTPESCKFKRNLGFKLHDVINCKEQTVLESIKDVFEGENMQTQYSVCMFLSCHVRVSEWIYTL